MYVLYMMCGTLAACLLTQEGLLASQRRWTRKMHSYCFGQWCRRRRFALHFSFPNYKCGCFLYRCHSGLKICLFFRYLPSAFLFFLFLPMWHFSMEICSYQRPLVGVIASITFVVLTLELSTSSFTDTQERADVEDNFFNTYLTWVFIHIQFCYYFTFTV